MVACYPPGGPMYAKHKDWYPYETSNNRELTVLLYVNDAWARLCEFDKAECVGKSNQLIQGPETDFELCRRKMAELLAPPHTCAMTQVNYKQSGEPFRNRVTIRPVLDAAREPRYFVAKLNQEDPPPGLALGGAGVVLQPPAAAAA